MKRHILKENAEHHDRRADGRVTQRFPQHSLFSFVPFRYVESYARSITISPNSSGR